MNAKAKKYLIILAVVVVVVGFFVYLTNRPVENYSEKYANVDLDREVVGLERTGTYKGYLKEHSGASNPGTAVDVTLDAFSAEGEVSLLNNFEGVQTAVYTGLNSVAEWNINVPEAGFYNIYLEYLIPESHGVPAERCVLINGQVPFDDAQNISLTRIWTDNGEKKIDNQGNEIRPGQKEVFDWQNSRLSDDRGYESEPYKFYLDAGSNKIGLRAENEPLVIKKLSLVPVQNLPSYSEYEAANAGKADGASNVEVKIQGEDANLRSESSLYAKFDRSSPTTEPNSVTYTVLNYTGGEAWKTNGQWIQWEFEVPADGYYNIMIKGRQNYSRGNVSNRILTIDGEIPFNELREVSFKYDNDWQYKTLGDENGDYKFYLTAGKHTIRLTATLGTLGGILSDLEDSTFRLNQVYRRLLVYTGASPDKYRDYHVETTYPEVLEAMDIESKRLYRTVDEMVAYSGQKAEGIATAQTVAIQLERFCEKPQKVTTEFTTFKDNVTAIGTSTLTLSESKLDIDYLVVSSTDVEPETKKANIFTKGWHEIKSFVASYFVDYNSVGDVYDEDSDKVIKVWVMTGRDQGTILKSMIDDTFTPETGSPVNVEIVGADALLNAVMVGRGPNVALTVGADQPVNYALRGASEDLTQFSDWQDVFKYFSESSYEQYRLDEHIYGVPETQTFNVMFYRKDILDELELEVPNTWQEFIELLPTIQGNNLSVGIPSAAGSSSTGAASTATMSNYPDLSLYFSLLFQNGGDMYNEAGTKTTVNDEAGMKAFDDYVRYFNDYGLPTIYDFVTRFRSGEMPIGIAPYSTYNTLQVSAPEIRGLWDFTLIPGTPRTDENGNEYLDRSCFITGSATMMTRTTDEQLKQNAWEFMKWWAQPETQIRFGREMEALLGASARYNTANREAFSSLSWSAKDIETLEAQWAWTKGIREVPGGYFTGRHISNAIRKVINERVDTRESIIDYSILIDEEIVKKRKEFGLPVDLD